MFIGLEIFDFEVGFIVDVCEKGVLIEIECDLCKVVEGVDLVVIDIWVLMYDF